MSHDYRDKSKNCYAFEDDITFSMKADMRNKKFGANVHKENNFNVLKTVGMLFLITIILVAASTGTT